MNWEQLGLKCGIEIHQELEGKKLFCNCPTELRLQEEPHFKITRQLRAVAGEAGQVDVAALQEMQKGKNFVYQGFVDSTCLVELDETPPNPVNKNAFLTALQAAKMLRMNFVDEVQVMRKTVIDGSNTSGFQRTMLIGTQGVLKTKSGNIGVQTFVLEEDSCRHVADYEESVVYSLDRLGIPLLEIATAPDIKTPEQCREVAQTIGLLLRSTGKVKRGIGTIRQDINVSIKGGNRVEIKGAQDLNLLPKLVEQEALRQKALVEIKNELGKRGVKPQTPQIVDLTSHLKHSGSKIIKTAIRQNKNVFGIRLKGFAGLVGKEVQQNRRLGTEFADKAKVICGVKGIFHSDELPAYGITEEEVSIVKKMLHCHKDKDAFVLVAETKNKAERALQAVIERANQAVKGVPEEVRKANPDGTTSYLRPMPGAARMYPETDIPPLRITKSLLDSIELPETIPEKIKKYQKLGLSKDLAELTAKTNPEFFEHCVNLFNKLKPAYVAEVLFGAKKTIKTTYGIEISPTKEDFEALFEAVQKEKIPKEAVLEILKEKIPVKKVLDKYKMLSDKELEQELKKIVAKKKGLQFNALVGEAMKQLRGKAPGKRIAELLKKLTS